METSELRQAFVRQRRALIATSLGLVTFQGLGASLDTIVLLGNTITLDGPIVVTTPLWVAWAYFLLRYYPYFRDLGDTGLKATLFQCYQRLAIKAAPKYAAFALDLEGYVQPKVDLTVGPVTVKSVPPHAWVLEVQGSAKIQEQGGQKRRISQGVGPLEVILPPGVPRWPRLRAALWTLLNTRLGAEYGLPFLLAALPPLIAVLMMLGMLGPAA